MSLNPKKRDPLLFYYDLANKIVAKQNEEDLGLMGGGGHKSSSLYDLETKKTWDPSTFGLGQYDLSSIVEREGEGEPPGLWLAQ